MEAKKKTTSDKYAALRLDHQLCFPLYACAKEIVRRYKKPLDAIDLTYTQYIVMMVVWEEKEVSVRELGKRLFLDSGTLTPVLKTLERKGFITRTRSEADERVLLITLTKEGRRLQDRALSVPAEVGSCLNLDAQEVKTLYGLLYKLLANMEE